MIAAEFAVTLTLEGPIMTQSSSAGAFGLDAVMAQSNGTYYLAGSLIKGLLHEAWQELASIDPSFLILRDKWLGKASPDASDDAPNRGLLFFEDLQDQNTDLNAANTLFRIKMDSERGSVERGAYQVIESPYKPGQPVSFTGTFRMIAQSDSEVAEVHKAVLAGLNWIQSAGAERTIGFGRTQSVVCGAPTLLHWQKKPAQPNQNRFRLTLEFDRPICMARRRIAGNYFESEDTIAGAALKGTLAALIDQDPHSFPLLRQHLWEVAFSHAFPDKEGSRPKRVRESKFRKVVKETFHDALRVSVAEIEALDETIEFSVDWKPDKWKPEERPWTWPTVKKELRVRTAIDSKLRRAADAELFAYEMLVTKGRKWIASATLPNVLGLADEFQMALQHGLFGIGKTKACAKVLLSPDARPVVAALNGEIAITLQTPALICDPSRHLAPNKENGTSDQRAMENEYRAAWAELSGGSLQLQTYFHRCSLAGSEYIRRRFQLKFGHPYTPYLMTDPGSVFLLKVADATKAKAFLEKALQNGLPLTPSVKRFYHLDGVPDSDLWQHCPYLPENGFGEIDLEVL